MSFLFLVRCSFFKEIKKKYEFIKWFILFILFNLFYIDDFLRVIMRCVRYNIYVISINYNYVEVRYFFLFYWVLFLKIIGNCLCLWGV